MASHRSGPLRAYRIADGRCPILDGSGAALNGGRWNSPGRRVIYAADTYAGVLLEKLVHTNIGRIPASQAYIEILIPEDVGIEEVTPADLPGWDAEDQQVSREYGDAWYGQQRTAVLVAPSVVTPVERNIVINQDHPDFAKIRASAPKPVRWDARLFGR